MKLKRVLCVVLSLMLCMTMLPALTLAGDATDIATTLGIEEGITFTNDDNHPWAVDGEAGTITSQINGINDAETTITAELDPGYTIYFKYTVSSEENYDQAIITSSDSTIDIYESGESTGEGVLVNDTTQPLTITWTYEKDTSVSYGNDCLIISDIMVVANGATHSATAPQGVKITLDKEGQNPVADLTKIPFGKKVYAHYTPAEGEYYIGWNINGERNQELIAAVSVVKDITVEPVIISMIPYDEEKEVYTISNEAELRDFSALVNYGYEDFFEKTIELTADIAMKGGNFTPIGKYENEFKGTFDGKGHTISDIIIESKEEAALFGWVVDAHITSVNLVDANIKSNSIAAGIVAYAYQSVDIDFCHVSGSIIADYSAGGIIACAGVFEDTESTVSHCEFNGYLKGEDVGGIASEGSGLHIVSCVASGLIDAGDDGFGIAYYAESVKDCVALQSAIYAECCEARVCHGEYNCGWVETHENNYGLATMLVDGGYAEAGDGNGTDITPDGCTAQFWNGLSINADKGWVVPEGENKAFAYRKKPAPVEFTVNGPEGMKVFVNGTEVTPEENVYKGHYGGAITFGFREGYVLNTIEGNEKAIVLRQTACIVGEGAVFTVTEREKPEKYIWVNEQFYLVSDTITTEREFYDTYPNDSDFYADATDSNTTPLSGSYKSADMFVLYGCDIEIDQLDLGAGNLSIYGSTSFYLDGAEEDSKLSVNSFDASDYDTDVFIEDLDVVAGEVVVADALDLSNSSLKADSVTILENCCDFTISDSDVNIGKFIGSVEESGAGIMVVGDSNLVVDTVEANGFDIRNYNNMTVKGDITTESSVYISGLLTDVRGSITAREISVENGILVNATECHPRPVGYGDKKLYRTTLKGMPAEEFVAIDTGDGIQGEARTNSNGELIVWLPATDEDLEIKVLYLNYDEVWGTAKGIITADGSSLTVNKLADAKEGCELEAEVPSTIKHGEELVFSNIKVDGQPVTDEDELNIIFNDVYNAEYDFEDNGDGSYTVEHLEAGTYYLDLMLNGTKLGVKSIKIIVANNVTFNANGHGTAPERQGVPNGNKITEPTAPTEIGYVFGGWYTTPECEEEWNFDTVLNNKDVELYAKWTVCDHSATTNHPTCTDTANCSVCGDTLDIIDHDHSDEWSYDKDYHWYECECGDRKDEGKHMPNLKGAEPPMVGVDGYTGDKFCSVCGQLLEKGEKIPALSDPNKPGGNVPNAGDNTNLPLWLSLMFVSLLGLAGCFLLSRKRATK